MPTIRQARVGEMIKRDLSEILQKEMRDERVALVTINSVDIARDFSIAKVFISCMGDDRDKALALKALQGASGFLRGQLGAMLELRVVPVLSFRYDTGVDKGVRMFELLKEEDRFFKDNPQVDEPAPGEPETPSVASSPIREASE
ncbi:MAG: 30S ribosome-binding factor RbfA [Armatimonadetes bacterium]|nr:30S ribosome-binding factor RbfA [Armatimonadota bacterium]